MGRYVAAPGAVEAVLADVARAFDAAGVAEVAVPYRCRAWTARRAG